jgi:hypothetical protein
VPGGVGRPRRSRRDRRGRERVLRCLGGRDDEGMNWRASSRPYRMLELREEGPFSVTPAGCEHCSKESPIV